MVRITDLEGRNEQKSDKAALGFAKMLRRLRRFFLQDMVHWRQAYPDHFIFEHDLFQSDSWRDWESRALAMTEERLAEVSPTLKDAVLEIASAIQSGKYGLSQGITELKDGQKTITSSTEKIVDFVHRQNTTLSYLLLFLSQPQPGLLEPLSRNGVLEQLCSTLGVLIPPQTYTSSDVYSATQTAQQHLPQSSPSAASFPSPQSHFSAPTSAHAASGSNASPSTNRSIPGSSPTLTPSTFKPSDPKPKSTITSTSPPLGPYPKLMDTKIDSVANLMKEYTVGWKGQPGLNGIHKINKCRKDERQLKHYSRRVHIYSSIDLFTSGQSGMVADVAARRLDLYRIKERLSLHQLDTRLKGLEDPEILALGV